jgi:hypothetical protein
VVSYKVNSQLDRAGFGSSLNSVERRYSDFVWLGGELTKEFPGVILPAMPDKQAMGRFSTEFVETRRRALEKYLREITKHHEMGGSETLVSFLQADDVSFSRIKDNIKNSKPKLTSTTFAWFEGTVNSITVGVVSHSNYFMRVNLLSFDYYSPNWKRAQQT